MKRSEALLPDHPLYAEAMTALKRYHEAKAAGAPVTVQERLRLHAEFLFQALTDYQLQALAQKLPTKH